MNRFLTAIIYSKMIRRPAILVAAFCALAATPLLSGAQPQASSLTIVNNSGWELRHVYLSDPGNDNWGPDLLNGVVIRPGDSYTLNFACGQAQVKVVTEDKDGCFLSNVVSCSAGAQWTITSDATPNCGGH